MRLGPAPAEPEVPGQFWIDFIRDTAPIFRKPTIEQLGEFMQPTWQALIDGAKYVDGRLHEIIDELAPDVIVEDNVIFFPALAASGRPWVRIVSCNPAELKDAAVPPFSSGYPVADRSGDAAFIAEIDRTHRSMWADYDAFCRANGAPGLTWHRTGPDFMPESPWLNLYVYPAVADYARAAPLGPTWHRLESCVRTTDGTWELPAHLRADAPGSGPRSPWAPDSGLVYLSLGSLGSADVGLLQRLIDVMGATRHRVIVSMGPLADQVRLHDNMVGAAVLPQPSILPLVDVVITHGGNNTVTECFHNGKPMVVLPLFWDQVDNAQRVAETGFGARLSTYGFDDAELTDAVDRLLADAPLRARMAANAARLQASPGTVTAADLIERVARTGQPVYRS